MFFLLTLGDFTWNCGNCMAPDGWDGFPSPPNLPPSQRNGCRPGVCMNARGGYSNFPGKVAPRSGRGRNFPWGTGIGGDEKFKGQRLRNGPAPYW